MNSKMQNTKPALILILATVLLLTLIAANLAFGTMTIPVSEVIKALMGKSLDNEVWQNVILRTRWPQTIVAFGAGMALGISGLLMQTLFRNPLAGPSVLGISSGASLGVAFVILIAGRIFDVSFQYLGAWGDCAIVLAALTGSMSVLLLILLISKKVSGTLGVLIMGVMFGYLANSIVGIFKYYSLEEDVHSYVIWGLGSFNRLSVDRAHLFAILTIIPSVLSVFLSKPLNLLALGDRYARNLGLRIRRARTLIILFAGVLTALVAAFCGPIIFIGLAVPHLAKLTTRTSNHFYLLCSSGLLGAATALLCNIIARMPGSDLSLPINSITAFVGAPVVISVIWKKRKDQLIDG